MTNEEVDKLILDNIKIAYKIAWKYFNRFNQYIEIEFDDIKSVSYIGLVKAANTFDNTKNFSFSTYAYRVIQNEILLYLRPFKNNIKTISIDSENDNNINLHNILKEEIDFEQNFYNIEMKNLLYKFINELPINLKQIIELRLKGLTQQEIANMLNISQPQVYRLISKSIYQLRLKFKDKNFL